MDILDERHTAGDGVTVELRYYGGKIVRIYIADPLGEDEATVPEGKNALDYFRHPYALAFPGRNPWEHIVVYSTTEDEAETIDDTAPLLPL